MSANRENRANPEDHRASISNSQGSSSQASTVRENSRDDITEVSTAKVHHSRYFDIAEEEESLSFNSHNTIENTFKFECDEKIPETVAVHPTDPSPSTFLEKNNNESVNNTKVPGQERITIVEDINFTRAGLTDSPDSIAPKRRHPLIETIAQTKLYKWLHSQYFSANNRYAFQISVGFTIAAMFVVITPISSIFPNAFWVGVSVVTVLDSTVGGLLNLSIQRFIGTMIGGASSIIVMTITRAIFHPKWEWQAALLLCFFMFIQVFFIAKIKIMPNYAYAGGIGLLTTVIIMLSGYSDLIHNRMSYTAELGAWRTLNLILGIFISLIVSLLIFPVKASSLMRQNLGKAMEDIASLYEKSSEYYLDFNEGATATSLDESLASKTERKFPEGVNDSQTSISEVLNRAFLTQPPGISLEKQKQIRQQIEDSNRFWTHDTISNISNEALSILGKLQVESTRLRNVSNEYYVQFAFHLFGSNRDRHKRDLRRAKRYNESIEAMKRIAWPLVSFRLLLPLISLSQANNRLEAFASNSADLIESSHQGDAVLQDRIKPTCETLESFSDSIQVMLRLGKILKDYNTPLGDFPDDWLEIDRLVTTNNFLIQRELKQTVRIAMYSQDMDGLKLLSYYGFLVRCSMIWDSLKTVVEKLSPLNGTLSRASSMGTPSLPAGENQYAYE